GDSCARSPVGRQPMAPFLRGFLQHDGGVAEFEPAPPQRTRVHPLLRHVEPEAVHIKTNRAPHVMDQEQRYRLNHVGFFRGRHHPLPAFSFYPSCLLPFTFVKSLRMPAANAAAIVFSMNAVTSRSRSVYAAIVATKSGCR